jgi:hypothetical protein
MGNLRVQLQLYSDRYHLTRDFVKVICEHCPRDANAVAHELASLAKRSPPIGWMEDPPPSIVPLLIHDDIIEN